MRDLKILLQLLLENLEEKELYGRGMCFISIGMREAGIYSNDEFYHIIDYLFSKAGKNMWLFPKGEKEPRIKFLKEEIARL